jgi:hypothetical protein
MPFFLELLRFLQITPEVVPKCRRDIIHRALPLYGESSFHFDDSFPEMLLVPCILVGRFSILKVKDLVIHDWFDFIRIDGPVHLFKLQTRPYQDTSDYAAMHQRLQHTWLFSLSQESDDGNYAVHLDCVQRLLHRPWTTNLEYVVDSIEGVNKGSGASPTLA